jgi:hypothetical protein
MMVSIMGGGGHFYVLATTSSKTTSNCFPSLFYFEIGGKDSVVLWRREEYAGLKARLGLVTPQARGGWVNGCGCSVCMCVGVWVCRYVLVGGCGGEYY